MTSSVRSAGPMVDRSATRRDGSSIPPARSRCSRPPIVQRVKSAAHLGAAARSTFVEAWVNPAWPTGGRRLEDRRP